MIQPNEFRARRTRLMQEVGPDAAVVLAAAPAARRNRDVEYPYRQNSDFQYLTGFAEPEALALLLPGRAEGEFVLFCRPFDAEQAVWVGRRSGLDGARADFGADQAFAIQDAEVRVPDLLEGRSRVYAPMEQGGELALAIQRWMGVLRARGRSGIRSPDELVALEKPLHEMRLVKSHAELALMREAARVSVAAHLRALGFCHPGIHEYEIEAEILHEFNRNGLRAAAYPSIVAGGANACVLHYTDNRAVLKDGDLLLVDAGAECDHYAADITRTIPVNGRFSPEQRAIYQLVLDAQLAALAHIRPGARWNEAHVAAVRVLTEGLVRLGLLRGEVDELIAGEAYRRFYMHRTGHWLGMDVHDVGDYRRHGDWRVLEPDMVMTVEPGLYIAADCPDVEARWRGIGVRIEDNVRVSADGHEILTAGAPKTIQEIERIMGER